MQKIQSEKIFRIIQNLSLPTFLNVIEPNRHFSCRRKEAFQVVNSYKLASPQKAENETQIADIECIV